MQYFEQDVPGNDGMCSWDPCPCGSFGSRIPRGHGYLYIPQSAVDFRRDCLTSREFQTKLQGMVSRLNGADLVFTDVPDLVCDRGIGLLDIDPLVAAKDAEYWWRTGLVPLRTSPKRARSPEPLSVDVRCRQEEVRKERVKENQGEKSVKRKLARENAEEKRRSGVMKKRKAAGQCVMCGKSIGFLYRLFGKDRHVQCKEFHS